MPHPSKPRARDLGIPFDGTPGTLNAITDVPGVEVGQTTLIEGAGPLKVGEGPIRTGVTAILPRGKTHDPCFAGWYALNGNGEMTGTTWIEESGFLEGPIGITNTHSVGVVHDAIIGWLHDRHLIDPIFPDVFWSLSVVGETYDGILNDINGFHVKSQHAIAALDSAKGGPVTEGAVGGGTGMICYGFKGGIGTASRMVADDYTIGVLVQSNFGRMPELTIAGVPVGRHLLDDFSPDANRPEMGSIIVIVATDAPLLPHQLKRLARRVPLGIGRTGTTGGNSSGDIFLAFSTANPGASKRKGIASLEMMANTQMDSLFAATVQATEESIINALVAAETMTGINDVTIHALPQDRVMELLKEYNRLADS